MTAFGPDMPQYVKLAPGIRRIVAPNPSMMTGPGTNTYLLGKCEVAVLDPGPDHPGHLAAIRDRAPGPIRWIIVTHTHADHSPGATSLARLTGAELIGALPPNGVQQDETFVPDRVLEDGDLIESSDFRLRAVHTPGHASNHFCFHHKKRNWLFTGDQVIDGSTVVINPPDGNMKDYLQSLERLMSIGCNAIAPGHGELIEDPARVMQWIIDHRLKREARVYDAVNSNRGLTSDQLVAFVYEDVPTHLHVLAERSLLAHLQKLEDDGRCYMNGNHWYIT
jgi:glyoxylase-like metal-dependent hydrolase (beta-lactamase superfamily II)